MVTYVYSIRMTNRITIEYKGKKYYRYPDSKRRQLRVYYWRHDKWKGAPVALHRQIYEDNFGLIPKGWHIHHIDGNTENNSPQNLQAMPACLHASIESKKSWEETGASRRANRSTTEARKKNSIAQKNRMKKELTCEFCGDKFMSRAYNSKWCPECKANQFSDKYGRHFKRDYQIKRFGRIVVPYIVK